MGSYWGWWEIFWYDWEGGSQGLWFYYLRYIYNLYQGSDTWWNSGLWQGKHHSWNSGSFQVDSKTGRDTLLTIHILTENTLIALNRVTALYLIYGLICPSLQVYCTVSSGSTWGARESARHFKWILKLWNECCSLSYHRFLDENRQFFKHLYQSPISKVKCLILIIPVDFPAVQCSLQKNRNCKKLIFKIINIDI